jgi:hypothetical protein
VCSMNCQTQGSLSHQHSTTAQYIATATPSIAKREEDPACSLSVLVEDSEFETIPNCLQAPLLASDTRRRSL